MEVAVQMPFELNDPADAGFLRREAVRYAEQIGMDETDRGGIAIVATEIATNVLKHAGRGKVILDPVAQNGTRGLRLVGLDKGPGIRDISAALRDGHSTAGTSGTGLGAIRRLSSAFEVYSYPEKGTCVWTEFWPNRKPPKRDGLDVGVVSLPIRTEAVCGDGWGVRNLPGWFLLMVVDGLGHGILAAEAAREAERVLTETNSKSPAVILQDTHDALRKTRGAAVAVGAIDCEVGRLTFSGIGNISAVLLDPQNSRGLASHNGTAGHQMRKVQEFAFPWNHDSVLIMHSDGLAGRWNLSDYPGIWNKPASVIAAVLYRDYSRERDDVTVLVAKSF